MKLEHQLDLSAITINRAREELGMVYKKNIPRPMISDST